MDGTKVISNWQDLEQYGIMALTGEACTLSMRLLCDLTQEGANVVTRFLGGGLTFNEGFAWNSRGVTSVMLPTNIYPELGAFCLHVVDGYQTVCKMPMGVVVGVDVAKLVHWINTEWQEKTPWQVAVKMMCQANEIERYYTAMPGSIAGRNMHQMSGRIE